MLLAILVASAGCSDGPSYPPTVNAVRGSYLVHAVLACGDCHTTPQASGLPSFDPSDFLAGGRQFPVETGMVYSRNLTSDVATGIGGWTDAQVKRAITQGLDDQAKPLSSEMPYWAFGNLSDNDLQSIVLFLRTLPAKSNNVPDNTVEVTQAAPRIDASQVPHTMLPVGDASFAAAERGRYLASVACITCHTQDTGQHGALDLSRAFAGGQMFNLGPVMSVSKNLTPDSTGLAGWSTDDVIKTIQFGKEKGTGRALCPPMPAGPNRDGDMTPGDLADLAAYLTTIAPIVSGPYTSTCPGF
jgi:mono/diheme cytochrome c family protein